MQKILKDLSVALLNATLILLALCLFLAWKVVDTADNVASNFASNLITVEPLRADVQAATEELAAVRQDMAKILDQSGELQSATLKRITARLAKLDTSMANARNSISELSETPYRLVDYAIETSADILAQKASYIRGCVPPQS